MEKRKDPMALSIQGEALDRVAGNDWSDLHQGPTSNSSSHNAELQEGAFPVAYFTAPGTYG